MDLGNLPILDWQQAITLAGGKREFAEEMLQLVIKQLAEDLIVIHQLCSDQNHHDLLQRVHKLHGALCYTGLTRLKTLVNSLESDLKNNIMINSPLLIDELNVEYNQLLKHLSSATAQSNSSTDA